MKHAMKLMAAGLLLSTGLFAAAPLKHARPNTTLNKRMITFSQIPTRRGIEIKLNNPMVDKAMVMIYDWNNDVVWKDVLSPKKGLDRAFILNQLDNGNYTVQVTVNNQLMAKKTAHIYYKGNAKFVSLRG